MLCLIFIIIPTVSLQVVQSLFYNDTRIDHGSCRFRSVRQAEFNWNSPEQSMTESFVLDDIEYKLCRYHVTWDEALVFCSSHKAHLATLDSEEKTTLVVQAMASMSSLSEEYWIGAKQIYEEPWKWYSNGMALTSEEDIISKIPIWYPGFESNNIHCLTIDRSGHNEPIFIPRACNQRRGFICQRDNDRAFDNKIRMVAATRIGGQEFRLYAGRISWPEAVVHCRQEGLQIGEVNTVEEARALASSMLRNRPEGIESVWIGGYTKKDEEYTWRWLASGAKIAENNAMWRKDLTESSGSCLLLDRHVCETPVYVESSCDRKRDVLCQKPPKKLLSKTPVPVVVDGCPYWIGFYPLKWLDARRACESLNASLVVLDSPATISHMTSLMLDNKAELRHIWTNGRRSKTDGQWIWDVTGEIIPAFGKSFIPWCPDDDYYSDKENSCLNLDREKLDSPLVYGLSCREKQTYVCQPYVGNCVFHSTPNLPMDAMINASEDIEEETTFKYPSTLDKYMATLTMSTITTPFSIVNLNDDVIQTLDRKNYDLGGDLITWKSTEKSIVEKNASSQGKFTEYMKPFTSFTLPSLPQFGIKVVSASTNLPSSIDMKRKKNKAYKLLTTPSHVTHLPLPSPLSTSVEKASHSDGRKSLKDDLAGMSNLSNSQESTISSISIETAMEKSFRIVNTSRPAFTQISPSLQSFLGSKSSSKSSKASSDISTTSSLIISDDSFGFSSAEVDDGTKKNSMKTTRDLNSSDTTTTKAPEGPNLTNKQISTSGSRGFQRLPPKSIDLLVVKKGRPDGTFVMIKRPSHSRTTTETSTPYDAIDMEYYNDDKYDKSTTKKGVDESARKSGESIEYSEDLESIPNPKKTTKKKPKHASITNLGNNLSPGVKDEEDEEEEEDNSEEVEDTVKSPVLPLATELSKNLENALVKMIKNGLDKKNSEKPTSILPSLPKIETKTAKMPENPTRSNDEDNEEPELDSEKREHITFRPYYAFEGAMIADLPEVVKLEGGNRKFKFIGKKLTPESFDVVRGIQPESKNDSTKFPKTDPRSHPNTQPPSNPQNDPQGNFPISLTGMPAFRTNDPNSMIQLGQYFKNQFSGLRHGSSDRQVEYRGLPMTNSREEIVDNGQRRFLQERLRGYPVNRGEITRNKGQQQLNQPLKRPGSSESDAKYYAGGRGLYPRENYNIYGSLPQREGRNNEETLGNSQEKLDVTWPGGNVVNYDNLNRLGQPVLSRSSPAPRRTTRSFHEKTRARTNNSFEQKPFPDFTLSKLVKEVKIDLDQRMLRRYLEGFSKKIARKSPGAKDDDWKDTWRQLLKQIMSVIDRMNINVNGNLMKLRVGNDDWNHKLSLSLQNSRKPRKKSGTIDNEKQRKDSASRNYANLVKKMNENLRINSTVENREKLMRATPNNLQIKDSKKRDFKPLFQNKTADRETTTRSSLEKEKIIKVTAVPVLHINYNKSEDKLPHSKDKTDTTIPKARLSTVFGYRSLMPQLHHRIIFQPGWGQIQAKSGLQKTVLKGESLPEGTLPKILNSEKRNEHFEGIQNEAQKPQHNLLASTNSTAKSEKSDEIKLKMHDEKNNVRSKVASVSETSENDSKVQNKSNQVDNQRDKVPATNYNFNQSWRGVPEEIGRNKLRNEDFDGYYNATYEESKDRKIDDGNEEMEEEIPDDGTESPGDYNPKAIWTPAHRLSKALELSMLRKFPANPSNSMRSKNLVTRSVKETEPIRQARRPEIVSKNNGYTRRQKMEQTLENLNEEPSVISIRMIMNPDKKSSRILRQSQDRRRTSERNPRTVQLLVQFSGKEQSKKAIKEKMYSKNHSTENDKSKKTLHRSVHSESSENVKNKNSKSPVAISDLRDRKYRNIESGTKNALSERNAVKKMPNAKHYIASTLRHFNEKNLTSSAENKWKNGGKDLGIDWAEQASALFADFKESNDDLTLYIDLTLGRVGTKPRIRGRSKG